MAHFAKINANNIVEMVLVGRDEDEDKELELSQRTGDIYRRTSYNTFGGVYYGADGQPSQDQSKAFRKNFAGIGYIFDSIRDAFYAPQPYPDWILNETTCIWEPPVARPAIDNENIKYFWNQEKLEWEIYQYDAVRNGFIPPQPYPNWVLHETLCLWIPPVPKPTSVDPNVVYVWNQENLIWEPVQI